VSTTVHVGSFAVDLAKVAVLGLLGAFSALAVHRTAAVYHDGLRTSIPELWRDQRPRRSLTKYSYSISMGFILAYALPYSLATGIIVIHILLLSCDMIGLWFRRLWQVLVAGFLYGAAMTVLVSAAAFGLHEISGFGPSLQQLFAPVVYTFPLIAAVAIANLYGIRWGALSVVLTLALWRAAETALHGGGLTGRLTPEAGAIALAVMTVVLVATAVRRSTPASIDPALYAQGVSRIRRLWPYLLAPPVLIAVAASQGWLAGEPLQLVLLATDSRAAAAAVAFYSAVAFVPLIAMTGAMSGVWCQDGYPDWYLGAGYLIQQPVLAGGAGLALGVVEIFSIRPVMRLLGARPRIHSMGTAAREAMDQVPGLSVLAGAVMASVSAAGVAGAGLVIGAYALNEAKGRPIMPLAVPVFAFLVVVPLAGLLTRIGLA
jgi:hypothetical protein